MGQPVHPVQSYESVFFRRIKTPALAHNAYVLGGAEHAIVVDPRRDIGEYLRVARDAGLTITHVVETHRQEDFVIGSAALARATGAMIVTGSQPQFGHGDIRLADGDELAIDGFRIRALLTPGHTPESTSYAVFFPESPRRAWGVFTGDALFAGTTGRTDLVDPRRTGELAGQLYDALHDKLLPLGDQAMVLPAHGAGSVCGSHILNRDETTIGLEREYNAVFLDTRAAFIRRKLEARVPRLPTFDRVAELNSRGGVAMASHPDAVRVLEPSTFDAARGGSVVIDTRSAEAFAGGHIPGSINVWYEGLGVFGAWVANPSSTILLVLDEPGEAPEAVAALARLGIDGVVGVLGGGFARWSRAGRPVARSGTITPTELAARREQYVVVDVREDDELASGTIPNARHAYVGHLDAHLADLGLERDDAIAVTCSAGHRAALGVSLLRRRGFRNVSNLLGGMTAWRQLGLPVERRRS